MIDDTTDPFALGGRQDDDADMFANMAAYRRFIAAADAASQAGDDDETARLSDAARPYRDRVEQYRPVTLQGVLAALDFASEITDPDYWPEGAIEGLRVLVEAG
jgi:hypothetical protein